MIPIISLLNIANAIVSGFIAWRLYQADKKNPSQNIRFFFYFYFFFALNWALSATPGIITKDPQWAMITNLLSFPMTFAGVFFGVQIPFRLLNKKTAGLWYALCYGLVGIVFLVGRLLYSQPSVIEIIYPFIYYKPIFPAWLRVIAGAANVISACIFIGIFLYLAKKSKENKIVYHRSLSIALGMSFLTVSAIIVQIIPTANFINLASGSTLIVLGLLIMAHGILHHHAEIASNENTPGVVPTAV